MFASIAAATLALALPAPVAGLANPLARPLIVTPGELAARRHCRDAARFQTGYEPALLFRRQEAERGPRRLTEMPEGAMCLIGQAPAALEVGR